MSVVIAGIHTGIGKTICSAVLCQALGYDYWKPVQAGELHNTDSHFIERNTLDKNIKIHPEAYRLQTAASPHYAAALEGIEIQREKLALPSSANNMVVETAGGLMSPLAGNFLNIDLVKQLQLPVVLVSNPYLGSINHSLLSIEALRNRNIPVMGIVFSGEENKPSENFILQYSKLPFLFSIPLFEEINAETIQQFSTSISLNVLNH